MSECHIAALYYLSEIYRKLYQEVVDVKHKCETFANVDIIEIIRDKHIDSNHLNLSISQNYIDNIGPIHALMSSVIMNYINLTIDCIKIDKQGNNVTEKLITLCDKNIIVDAKYNFYNIYENKPYHELHKHVRFIEHLQYETTLVSKMLISEMLYYLPYIVHRYIVHRYNRNEKPICMAYYYFVRPMGYDYPGLFGYSDHYFRHVANLHCK
jgi:hypothetical protein